MSVSEQLPRPDPDGPLVTAARGGDFAAFEQLVSRHERSLYTLALRMLQRPEDAEEIVQETFLSVVEHLADFQGEALFHTWLVRIATNHALKLMRRKKVRRAASLETAADEGRDLPHPNYIAAWRDDPVKLAADRETGAAITAALAELDEKYRLVFLLRDVEELSIDETAALLKISPANVKVRLLRARLMLRERLTRMFGNPDQQLEPHRH